MTAAPAIDHDALMNLVGRFATDLGATLAAGSVVIGHRLGLYRALADTGPTTAEHLAATTGTTPRYVQEWLCGQAAGGYVSHLDDTERDTERHTDTDRWYLTAEQAFALTDPHGPLYLPGAFVLALGALRAEPRITEAFRSGAGVGWHEHDSAVFTGCELFFRPGYAAELVTNWLPALDGIQERLRAGGRIADVGCGLGASSILMATAYPAARVNGSDYHAGSVDLARDRAQAAGVADRTLFEVAAAHRYSGTGYDLVTTFDCLHDMGDPIGVARHVRESLDVGGSWLIVEPAAGDRVTDNLNPVGRVYYGASTLLCVPNALSQPGGHALGAQAGENALRAIAAEAGFGTFRRVADTMLNNVYEAKP